MAEKLWMKMGLFRIALIAVGLISVFLTSWQYLNILVLVRFIYFSCTLFIVLEAFSIDVGPEALQPKNEAAKKIFGVGSHIFFFVLCLSANIIQSIFVFPYNQYPPDHISAVWGFLFSALHLVNVCKNWKDRSIQVTDVLRNLRLIVKLPGCLFGVAPFAILELSGYPCYPPYDQCNFSYLWVHYAFILNWMVGMATLFLILTDFKFCSTILKHCLLVVVQFALTIVLCRVLTSHVKDMDPNFSDARLNNMATNFGYVTSCFFVVEFVVLCLDRKTEPN